MKKYLVIDERIDGNGDEATVVCDTAIRANDEAMLQWNYLTAREQKNRHIFAVVVTEDDLADWAIDEETGKIRWHAYESYNHFEGAFDSKLNGSPSLYNTSLKRRRLDIGLSQSELAEASGVSLRSIQEYEQGRKPINGVAGLTLYKLAKALGVMIEDLLEL